MVICTFKYSNFCLQMFKNNNEKLVVLNSLQNTILLYTHFLDLKAT